MSEIEHAAKTIMRRRAWFSMLNGVHLASETWNRYNNKILVKNEALKALVYMPKRSVVRYNDYIYIALASNVFMA